MMTRTLLSIFLVAGCASCVTVTKKEIDAALFLHEQLPESICSTLPDNIRKMGVYRILTCTDNLREVGICQPGQTVTRERMSYCKPQIKNYGAIKDSELAELLKKARIK